MKAPNVLNDFYDYMTNKEAPPKLVLERSPGSSDVVFASLDTRQMSVDTHALWWKLERVPKVAESLGVTNKAIQRRLEKFRDAFTLWLVEDYGARGRVRAAFNLRQRGCDMRVVSKLLMASPERLRHGKG